MKPGVDTLNLDSPERFEEIQQKILSKRALRKFYENFYEEYRKCLNRSVKQGLALEFGSGAGFVKEMLPEVITTDVIPYKGVDRVMDVTSLPLEDSSVKAAFFMNVLHHIPDAALAFKELNRALIPGGRILIVDQYPGWISGWILRNLHHEGYDDQVEDWKFASSGPLSSANGALPWIIFFRDRKRFEELFPKLEIVSIKYHHPFLYWLSGGLKDWSLVPNWAVSFVSWMDNMIVKVLPGLASFMTIEIERKP